MTLYAIPESFMIKEEIRPFAGCYLVLRHTKLFVWLQIPQKEDDPLIRKVHKKNIRFYSNSDISSEVEELNKYIQKRYSEHMDIVASTIKSAKEKYKDVITDQTC